MVLFKTSLPKKNIKQTNRFSLYTIPTNKRMKTTLLIVQLFCQTRYIKQTTPIAFCLHSSDNKAYEHLLCVLKRIGQTKYILKESIVCLHDSDNKAYETYGFVLNKPAIKV